MIQSENFAINHHMADVITQSFGATEPTFPSARRSSAYAARTSTRWPTTSGAGLLG